MTNNDLSFSQEEENLAIVDSLKLEELSDPIRRELELCLMKAFELYNSYSRNKKVANWEKILRDVWGQFLGQAPSSYGSVSV